jgi:LemA protein
MDELAGTQNRISTERGRFIESVQSYNVGIRVFPANLIAGMFGFEQVKYFEAAEGAGSNITVNL